MNAMETKAKNPWVAGILSGVLPGLGQFYNRQLGKGAGFLIGFLVLAGGLVFCVDLQALEKGMSSGARPGNLWLILAGGGVHLIPVILSVTAAPPAPTPCLQKTLHG